jgi:hypothetical protein
LRLKITDTMGELQFFADILVSHGREIPGTDLLAPDLMGRCYPVDHKRRMDDAVLGNLIVVSVAVKLATCPVSKLRIPCLPT